MAHQPRSLLLTVLVMALCMAVASCHNQNDGGPAEFLDIGLSSNNGLNLFDRRRDEQQVHSCGMAIVRILDQTVTDTMVSYTCCPNIPATCLPGRDGKC